MICALTMPCVDEAPLFSHFDESTQLIETCSHCDTLRTISATDVRTVWRHVCFKNPFPPFLFGIPSVHSLPEALLYACIMPIPSLQLKIKTSLMQRSKGFGHEVVVSKICYVIYSDCVQDLDYRILIVLSVATRGCCKPMNDCRDCAFSNSGLEVGLPAFQLPMFSKCDALPKGERFVWHVCLRNPLPPFLFGFRSIQSLPEAWGSWERQHAASALHYACIMPIPSLQLKIKTSLMQRSKGFGHGVVVSKICYAIYSDCVQDLDYRILIVLSVVTRGDANQWTIVEIELLETLGWKCGCQPFSRRCSLNVMHCRKERDLFDMFV